MKIAKSIGHTFATAVGIMAVPIAILAFLKRDDIKDRVKKFDPHSLSAISDRIFNNGITAIKSMKEGVNHDQQD